MSFLRRLFGGSDERTDAPGVTAEDDASPAVDTLVADGRQDDDEAEQAHEREILRAEAERLDPLRQRQLRYASHAWTPPSQGTERRADDEDAGEAS